ncbi:MAG: DUF3617 domain-containing protein [Burkholderiaceae bacterium]|nr:DUF3617 domain-containing protein [Burkholderiaceae bacterium]
MRKYTTLVLLCTIFSFPTLAPAASPMKPGLWEITTQSDAMKNRPQISPQQAAQMRQMGINVPEMRNGGMVMKVCFTKEILSKNEPPSNQQEQDCQTQNAHWSGNSYSADIICNSTFMKSSGTIQGTYSATRFESNYRSTGTVMGKQSSNQVKSSGKWLGSGCGNVKPLY